jgi:hypothetical protein
MQRLTFWFEYGSTYTWLSVARIDALAQAHGAQIEWRPFLLSAILKQRGMVEGPFAEPVKGRYMWRDLERRAARHGIAYRKPTGSLPNTLLTARIEGLPRDESDQIIKEVCRYIENDSLIYAHKWQPYDMLIWDNWGSVHARTDFPADQTRLMRRSIVKGQLLKAA